MFSPPFALSSSLYLFGHVLRHLQTPLVAFTDRVDSLAFIPGIFECEQTRGAVIMSVLVAAAGLMFVFLANSFSAF